MSIHEDILQAVRSWLKTALTLTDAKVIVAEDDGPRPAMPYLTVKVLAHDIPEGWDEVIRTISGDNPVNAVRGQRSFTVSVQGFGAGAEEYLQDAVLSLQLDSTQDSLTDAKISLFPLGGATPDAAVRDTSFEPRFIREFEGHYQITSGTATGVPLEDVVTTVTLNEDEADEMDASRTYDLSAL